MVFNGFNITIGQPPQSIRMALSIESQYLMVQSSECQTEPCLESNHTGFNSSLSSTFQPEDPRFQKHFAWVCWEGFYAKDTVSFTGLELRNQSLLYAESIDWESWMHLYWYFDYDGVLGLAPHSTVWISLKDSGAIEKSIMGLRFPSGPLDYDTIGERNDGELTLGGIDPEFEDATFIDLPLADPTNAALWGTRCSSMTFDNKTHRIHEDMPAGSIAVFTSTGPFISIPGNMAWLIASQVYPYMLGMVVGRPIFPCEKRSELATFNINIGEGDRVYNLTLSAYEYTFKYSYEGKEVCFMAIDQIETDVVGLGWPYLRNFYTVFDEENLRIRCKFYDSLFFQS
jgi:hypothetical protein